MVISQARARAACQTLQDLLPITSANPRMARRVPWLDDVALTSTAAPPKGWCLIRCQVSVRCAGYNSRARSPPPFPTRVLPLCNQSIRGRAHSLSARHSPNVGYLASRVSGQTPLIGRKTGRLPKRSRRDGTRGSSSPDESSRRLETSTDRLFALPWTYCTIPYIRRQVAGRCS